MSSARNLWLRPHTAAAFRDQHKALPYQELLHDTIAWLDPRRGERWLDLGCGSGQLTAALWREARGALREIIALDCNPGNAGLFAKLRLDPPPYREQVRFSLSNFSVGLPQFADCSFDGIVSGLAISYAESRDPVSGRYTDTAFKGLLVEMNRVLKPGGRAVVSVNVPQPDFWKILWRSLRAATRTSSAGKALLNGLKMQWCGRWLRREASRGRFHYLSLPELQRRFAEAGFGSFEAKTSYANQAYLIRVRKTEAGVAAA